MDIIRLNGEDKKLYELVAPLIMNPAIIKLNNNYPYKTEKDYIWYIATDADKVEGFMPLKPTLAGYHIDNYYINDNKQETIAQLIETILEEHSNSNKITALVKKHHVKEFKKLGFSTWLELKLYTKMDYKNLEKIQE